MVTEPWQAQYARESPLFTDPFVEVHTQRYFLGDAVRLTTGMYAVLQGIAHDKDGVLICEYRYLFTAAQVLEQSLQQVCPDSTLSDLWETDLRFVGSFTLIEQAIPITLDQAVTVILYSMLRTVKQKY